jgi:hypothetical protein
MMSAGFDAGDQQANNTDVDADIGNIKDWEAN